MKKYHFSITIKGSPNKMSETKLINKKQLENSISSFLKTYLNGFKILGIYMKCVLRVMIFHLRKFSTSSRTVYPLEKQIICHIIYFQELDAVFVNSHVT